MKKYIYNNLKIGQRCCCCCCDVLGEICLVIMTPTDGTNRCLDVDFVKACVLFKINVSMCI